MWNLEKYLEKRQYTLVSPLGKAGGTLWLIETADGQKRVLRHYSGYWPVCHALADVRQEHLAQILAVCEVDGCTVSEEEYIEGTLLSELLRRTLLNVSQTAAVARALCSALQTLHDLGYVHRDLKPENIMLTPQGRVVLLDLDAAAPMLGAPDSNTTLLGTAGYAAPEQFGLSRCDVRADIFAMGVLMNVMCSGAHPAVHLASGRLRRVIARCIHTNIDQRYPNVQALARQLPKSGRASMCPLCGYVTPGGGCAYCGGAAKRTHGRMLAAGFAVLACVCAAFGLYGLHRAARAETALAQQSHAEDAAAQEPEAVSIQREQPLAFSRYTGVSLPLTVPFTYDLDQDGTDEQYCFALAEFWPQEEKIRVIASGTKHFKPGESDTVFCVPLICRELGDGGYEAVPELAGLLENASVAFYYEGERPQALPQSFALPDSAARAWRGAARMLMGYDTPGQWLLVGSAELAGQPVSAAIRVTAVKNMDD